MTDSIREFIQKLVSKQVFKQGEELYSSGAVLDAQTQAKSVQSRVANEQGRFEDVSLSFRANGVSSRCTCRVQVPVCVHATAVLLHLADANPDVFGFLGFGEEGEDPDAKQGQSPKREPTAPPRPPHKDSAPPPELSYFSALIDPDPPRRCSLHLKLLDGHSPLEGRWQHMRLKATLHAGDRAYSAGNIKKMLDGTRAAGGMHIQEFTPRERQIVRFLSVYAEPQDGSVFELDALRAADLFHCLIGFERFYTDEEQIHVHGRAAEPCLNLSGSAAQVRIRGRLELPGAGVLPEGRVVPVAGRGGVWLGVQGHYWWLPGIIDPGWLRFFVHNGEVPLTEDQAAELLKATHEGRVRARIIHDQEGSEIPIERPECTPILILDWPDNTVSALLQFDYGSVRVDPLDRRGGTVDDGYIVRDSAAEREAADFLARQGFSWNASKRCYELSSKAYLWDFVHHRLELLEGPWRLFMSPAFVRKQSASDTVSLNLHTDNESGGWFDLRADLPQAEEVGLSWEAIAEACRAGENYVTAEDGTVMQLSDDVRRVVETLLAHAREKDGDRLTFDISSAFPVAEALGKYADKSVHESRWHKLREMFLNPDLATQDLNLPDDLDGLLRDYQREGVSWLAMLEDTGFHGILADEMGLGKTIQALAALARRRRNRQDAEQLPSLVVCPTSLIENWLIESKRFAPELKTIAVRGLQRRHLIERLPELDIAITSYALLRRDVKHYEKYHLDYLILDEAQHIKNPGTANARTCKSLSADHRLILTGTPLENSLQEVWSLFDYLLPGFLGTQKQFRERFGNGSNESVAREPIKELAASIRPFVLRRTKDEVCRQLPPKIEQVVYCHLDSKQQKLHQNLLAAGREMVRIARKEGWNTRRFQVLSLIMRLRQVCCHPRLLPDELLTDELRDGPSAKTELLKEIVEEAIDGGHRILLFSQFTSFLKIFREWLEEQDIEHEYLDGNTPNRQERVDHFNNDPSIPVFLLSLKAGGTGLNLTGADTVIHYDQWWNPMVEDQATDRTHRIGQDKPVTVYKLVAHHSVEERIRQLQQKKRHMFDQIMDGAPSEPGKLTDEDFEFLFGSGRVS